MKDDMILFAIVIVIALGLCLSVLMTWAVIEIVMQLTGISLGFVPVFVLIVCIEFINKPTIKKED